MEIFDSHAHYDDTAFDGDRMELLGKLPQSGVAGVVNAGISVASSLQSIELAGRFPFIYAAVGIHPEEAEAAGAHDVEKIGEMAQTGKKIVAIGEIGLDYHYEGGSREKQLALFEKQLSLANELRLPVIIHDREAHEDTFRLLRQYKPRGVLHCYSGSAQAAAQAVSLGLYLGFTGVVTFKNSRRAAEAIASIPRGRLLVETDCPYMAPEPLRGRRSDSSMLVHTIGRVAGLLGLEPEEAAALTARNARELFGIGPGPQDNV
jgi:TatD DNase family protein